MKKKVVVLVSGGMDSVAALYEAHQTHEVVGGLSFDYDSKHNHKEIPFAAWHCQKLVDTATGQTGRLLRSTYCSISN